MDVATRAQVKQRLEQGDDYEQAARALGIPAGQAFMIATGLPADASDPPSSEQLAEAPTWPSSSQQLINPPAVNPKRDQRVLDWVESRAARELLGGS
jgi:hypothetical protein